jgi:energy-coupling factor transporter ATP-binding protein EcfA2
MKATKLTVKNMFGIEERTLELDGKSVLLTGKKGEGKTSFIDSLIVALKNSSDRDYIIKNGASEGEVIVTFDNGVNISRKKRRNMSDYKKITKDDQAVTKAESFLKGLYNELQLNPVEFLNKSKVEKNNAILDLINFDWDLDFIKNNFAGELPSVNYEQNILRVLYDIQADDGPYYMKRRDVDRAIRHKKDHIKELMDKIPDNYNYEHWKKYDLEPDYEKLEKAKNNNIKLENAKRFINDYPAKVKFFESERDRKIANVTLEKDNKISKIDAEIEDLKKRILILEAEKGNVQEIDAEKKKAIINVYEREKSALDDLLVKANARVNQSQEMDEASVRESINKIKEYMGHIPIYENVLMLKDDIEKLNDESKHYDCMIQRARDLPGEILAKAEIPIKGISVKDGLALINGLPISNLSKGEQLDLCVDIAVNSENELKMILIDECEKLDDESLEIILNRCKEKGIQFIATKTTKDDELKILYV